MGLGDGGKLRRETKGWEGKRKTEREGRIAGKRCKGKGTMRREKKVLNDAGKEVGRRGNDENGGKGKERPDDTEEGIG